MANRYKGGPTIGGYWGIAAAALVAAPVFIFQLLVNTLGCEGVPDCEPDLLMSVLVPMLAVSLAVFWSVRTVVNLVLRGRAGT